MNFFKSFLAAFLALILFSIVCLVLFLGWIGSVTSEKEVVIKDNSVLHLKLDAEITEMQKENPFEGLPIPVADEKNVGLMQLKQAIKNAEGDANIKGIYVEVGYPRTGFSTLEEIRQALLDFRKTGKWVVAYNEVMSEGAYYLSSAADKVYLNPEGDIEFNGLTITVSFFKKLFEKLEIKPQIFRVGEFKSAVEPFMLEKMSPENELQLTELANSIYDYMLLRISETRNIPKEKLEEISDKMLVRNAQLAKEHGLVDDLYYEDEFLSEIKNRLNLKEEDNINFVKYGRYRKSFSGYSKSKNEIAVVVAEGTIMPGDEDQKDDISGEKFIQEIRKVAKNKNVKAIVVRVNSPGGDFRSSDMIWREIQQARKVKPVIASMSDYAASGGYYIAMGCDTIVAQPHTITGSIGVFSLIPDMSGFLGNKIGITFDDVRTGDFGDLYTVSRPLTEAEKRILQTSTDEVYETFTTKAAKGRDMSVEELKKVASGRVWTGTQAKERKLIDIEGTFDDAVRIAAEKAGVQDDYKVKFYPKRKSFLEQWFSEMEENSKANTIKSELGEYYTWYQQLQRLKSYYGTQARMPFEITFN